MELRHYVDIQLGPRPSPIMAAQALRALHGVFALHPGQYALALPDYPRSFPRLRVFAASREALDQLVSATKPTPPLPKAPTKLPALPTPKPCPTPLPAPG